MLRPLRLLALFAVLSCLAACASSSPTSSPASDIATACSKLVYCGQKDSAGLLLTEASCKNTLTGWIMPDGCADAFTAATCAEVTASTTPASLSAACFPPCSETTCNAAQTQVNLCTTSGTRTLDCAAVCEKTSQSYTGICAATYNGKSSSSGKPVCWCS